MLKNFLLQIDCILLNCSPASRVHLEHISQQWARVDKKVRPMDNVWLRKQPHHGVVVIDLTTNNFNGVLTINYFEI